MTRRTLLASLAAAPARPPNVVFILADDLGYSDLSITGNRQTQTPNIDAFARQGLRFSQFYTASPICSPSRVGCLTGQFPSRHRIYSFLNNHASNRALAMPDWLDPQAPSIARAFQRAGYRTAHFGKWHMGGGRDVSAAPHPAAYGFHESVTNFEGLGDRILSTEDGDLCRQSAALAQGRIEWAPKHRLTELYIDRALDFLARNTHQPSYLHLWPCDVHDLHFPRPDLLARYAHLAANPHHQKFAAVLDEFDRQIGRFLRGLDSLGLANNTIVVFTSDNGPIARPLYYQNGLTPPGSAAPFRGRKNSLYEGGIRQPLFIRWPRRIPQNRADHSTTLAAVDLFPSLASLAGIQNPAPSLDGENMSRALLGHPQRRRRPLFWEYGRTNGYPLPGNPDDLSPAFAIRSGPWKLLHDSTRTELFNIEAAPLERHNLAASNPHITTQLLTQLDAWRHSLNSNASPAPAPETPASPPASPPAARRS